MAWKQGLYKLKNPHKYLGDPRQLKYKSSWEEEAFRVCDNNPHVLEWAYEFIKIPYLMPSIRNPSGNPRAKIYIPDLYVVSSDGNGNVSRKVIEIKPYKQTRKSRSKNPNVSLYENHVHMMNQLKWQAAKAYCDANGIEFLVVTENELFANRRKR